MNSTPRSWLKCLAVLLALALAPAPALAAAKSKKASKQSTAVAESTPAETAPETSAPAPSPAPDPPPPPPPPVHVRAAPATFSNSPALGAAIGDLDFAGLIALDIPTKSVLDVGPRFTGEAMYNAMDLAPQLRLALGGRMSFAYHSGDFDSSFWALDFIPDAKLKFAVMDSLAVYGDFGMGLSILHGSVPTFRGDESDTTASFAVQFGGGVSYAVTPNLNLLGEIRFDFYTAAPFGGDTVHSIALPTVGVQYHY